MSFFSYLNNLPPGCTSSEIEGSREESDYVNCSTGCGIETPNPDELGRCHKCSKNNIETREGKKDE
jgi:hypothetical protein